MGLYGLVWVYCRCSAVQCMVVRRTMMLCFQISTTSQVNKDMYNMGAYAYFMHGIGPEMAKGWPRDGPEGDQRGTRKLEWGVIWYEMRPYRESRREQSEYSSRIGVNNGKSNGRLFV